MGDMVEIFREMRAEDKSRRHARLDKNMEIVKQCNLQCKIDTNYTVLFKTQNGTLSFYPTKNRFIKNMNKVK